MVHIGNTPASNFASVTKDTFSGDGSTTAFTLSKAATTNGVAVFVENVRQEPTTAYAVSGTTLTFTAAPVSASGNNIYVLHHNAPASTATHPAAQGLTATSGTFTGDVSLDGGNFVFNESSADKDFRVESNDQTHMLFVDGGINQVGVGVVPNDGWNTNFLGIDINNQGGIHHYTSADLTVENNAYFDSSNAWKYKRDGYASRLNFVNASGNVKFSSAASGSADGAISFLDNIEMEHSSGDLKVTRGDIFFAGSGKGINLGVTSNTDSNTLDDYEEGTFTYGTNANVTFVSNSNVGKYIKIGKVVHLQFQIDVSSVSGTNHFYLSSMPFPQDANDTNTYNGYSTSAVMFYNFDTYYAGSQFVASMQDQSSNMYFYECYDSVNWLIASNTRATSSTEMIITHTYFTSS